ncbi:MAG: cytochrome C [endosymbiont of Galathealinum brachiosum]|uniref:Cytochrome C n=1 Tax=endosymbiont of Galathealinum brachiosum TaxID=2200906 RepID=A0A370DIK7_9GAMM|nr:MAG: cytochrome C [endosymbiont of Galathealinum brachiosum]
MLNKKTLAILLYFLPVSNMSMAVEISPSAMLANSCAACHGTDGKSPGAIPAINGKSAKFISESLKEFQSGARPSTVMGRHSNGYSEQEIQLIAEFFSSK